MTKNNKKAEKSPDKEKKVLTPTEEVRYDPSQTFLSLETLKEAMKKENKHGKKQAVISYFPAASLRTSKDKNVSDGSVTGS